jgi:hypothetical protein
MKKIFLIISLFVFLSASHATRYYYTQQSGDPAVASTWLSGNTPAIPNFADTANRIYINHTLTGSGSGQIYIKCYVKINMGGSLTFSSAVHIASTRCYVEVWGQFIINNILYTEDGGIMEVFYGGYVFSNNKIDVTGAGNSNPGHIILHGGTICWDNLWKGPYPPEGYGVLCNQPNSQMKGCCTSLGPLGITLLSFSVSCSGDFPKLEWSTENEENNDHFTIERSKDLITWQVVAIIPGAGTASGLLEYTVFDENPGPGINYYRLSQTDFDGTTTTFGNHWIRFSNCTCKEEMTIFPNPFKDRLLCNYSGINNVEFCLFDILGHKLCSGILFPGENEIQVSVLQSGMYYIVVQNSFKQLLIKD